MGRGRARLAVVGVAALLALAAAGCGASSHTNEPRPSVPTRVSVTLGNNGVVVAPVKVAFGPERNQQIPQNQNHPQPPIKTKKPLNVVFVIANQTSHASTLRLHGTKDLSSEEIGPGSPATFRAELPTGDYTVTANGVPSSGRPTLTVGPFRASSQNDVLLP